MIRKRLQNYIIEAKKHTDLITESLEVLEPKLPIKEYDSLSQLERFALNALIFRFSKLQDLIGAKVFRNYLDYSGFDVNEITYYDILREIEKEGIIDIDTWNELRELRNKIAHEYPEDIDETVESINLFIQRSDILLDVVKKLESKIDAIDRAREREH